MNKIEFEMILRGTPSNTYKVNWLTALEIMFDDEDNELPSEWYEYFNNEAGTVVPWGSKFKVTIEQVG
jgi:hypothetical protein